MSKMRTEQFAGLDVVVLGGSDGYGGGEGPLCVLLHGFGAPGTDLVLLGQMLGRALGPAANPQASLRFAFPAAPLKLEMGGFLDLGDSRAWWMIDIEDIQRRMMTGALAELLREEPQGLHEAREQLVQALAELQKDLKVPTEKLVLGGFSQGSMLSLDVALQTRLPLRGLILWSSTLAAEEKWQKGMPERRGLPVLQTHGKADVILPFPVACLLRDQLLAAGLKVDFHEFEGGHEIPPLVLQATLAFLRSL
jgi:phospholipase/carboxylesterase